MLIELERGLNQIALIHNIIPIELAAILPAADLHGHPLRHAGANKIPGACPAQIVE